MGIKGTVLIYIVLLVVVVVGVDVLFFRHHFWPRLLSNIGIVLIFAAVYLRFIK
jgi:type IV secretory pathway VirB2 component (pilin)